jgi:acetyl esterase
MPKTAARAECVIHTPKERRQSSKGRRLVARSTDFEADGYAFPTLADLRGLCPTLVLNAEYDDLRSSGQAFAAALAAAGVDVRQVMAISMLHGFLNLPATIGPVSAALDLIAWTVNGAAAITA